MENWTKEQEIALINQTQDEYVNELIQKLKEPTKDDKAMKCINFTSPTGTGKTKMMAKLINSLPNYYFLVTTLSRGGLHYQVAASLRKDCKHNNWTAYGVSSYTKTSLLQDEDILRHIECLPVKTKIVWIRDEGHINSNNWMRLLEDKCDKIVNFSATNKIDYGILCKFSHTLMLRTVTQAPGTIEDALDKLTEVKKAHIPVHEYNPCALFRVVSNEVEQLIITACKKRRLKCVSLVDAQPCSTAELCEDNNPYDVIINKMKF